MFILFGFKTAVRNLFARPATCRYCHQNASQRVEERTSKFTVFFIPLFTTRRRYAQICANCGATTELSKSEKNALAS